MYMPATTLNINYIHESIPVGCVSPTFLVPVRDVYPTPLPVPPPPDSDPLPPDADPLPWMQTLSPPDADPCPLDADPLDTDPLPWMQTPLPPGCRPPPPGCRLPCIDPPGCRPAPPVDRMTDRRFWKHYLPAGGNKVLRNLLVTLKNFDICVSDPLWWITDQMNYTKLFRHWRSYW